MPMMSIMMTMFVIITAGMTGPIPPCTMDGELSKTLTPITPCKISKSPTVYVRIFKFNLPLLIFNHIHLVFNKS